MQTYSIEGDEGVIFMIRKNYFKTICFLFLLFIFPLIYPTSVIALSKSQRVYEICECRFPAEIGGYKNFKAINIRHTLFRHLPKNPVMVREIFAERKGKKYRIIALIASTKSKTVGKSGPIIEITKWNGPYWPSKVIYQLTLEQIYLANLRLYEN